MQIRFECPTCNGTLVASKHQAGKKFKCSRCGSSSFVPSVDEDEADDEDGVEFLVSDEEFHDDDLDDSTGGNHA